MPETRFRVSGNCPQVEQQLDGRLFEKTAVATKPRFPQPLGCGCYHYYLYSIVSDPQLKFGGPVRSASQASTPQVKPLSTHNIAVSWRGSRNNVSKRSVSVVGADARMLPKSLSNLDTVMWKGKHTTREGDYQQK